MGQRFRAKRGRIIRLKTLLEGDNCDKARSIVEIVFDKTMSRNVLKFEEKPFGFRFENAYKFWYHGYWLTYIYPHPRDIRWNIFQVHIQTGTQQLTKILEPKCCGWNGAEKCDSCGIWYGDDCPFTPHKEYDQACFERLR